jgi:hypothetical protein
MQTGRNPMRLKKRIVAAAVCAAAVAAGAAAWMLAPEERVETVTEVLTNSVTKVVEKVVAIKHIDRTENCMLFSTDKKVRVEVKLAKGSPAAQIQLVFKDESGKILWEERWTAKKSKKATVSVPQGAASATLSAGRASGDTSTTFDTFKIYPKQ